MAEPETDRASGSIPNAALAVNHPVLAEYAKTAGEIGVDDAASDEITVQIRRICPGNRREEGVVGTFTLDEVDPSIPEFIESVFGGGKFGVRFRRGQRWIRGGGTEKIAGEMIPVAEAKRTVAIMRGEPEPEPGIEDEDAAPQDPFYRPGPFVLPGYIPRPGTPAPGHGAPDSRGTAAEAIHAAAGMIPQQPDITGPLLNLVATMTGPRESDGGALDLAREIIAGQGGKSAEIELMLGMMERNAQLQQETMAFLQKQQSTAQAETISMMAGVMKQGMGAVIKLITDVKDAKEGGDLLDRLPDLVGRLLGPIGIEGPAATAEHTQAPPLLPAAIPGGEPGAAGRALPDLMHPATPEGSPPSVTSEAQLAQAALAAGRDVALRAVRGFCDALRLFVVQQPDVDACWTQAMEQGWTSMPREIRVAAEAAPAERDPAHPEIPAGGDAVGAAILAYEGVPAEWVSSIAATAQGAPGGMDWLASFWGAAPWWYGEQPEEDEPVSTT